MKIDILKRSDDMSVNANSLAFAYSGAASNAGGVANSESTGGGLGEVSWNDLKDKPFYEETTEVDYFPIPQAYDEDGDVTEFYGTKKIGLEIGKEYTIDFVIEGEVRNTRTFTAIDGADFFGISCAVLCDDIEGDYEYIMLADGVVAEYNEEEDGYLPVEGDGYYCDLYYREYTYNDKGEEDEEIKATEARIHGFANQVTVVHTLDKKYLDKSLFDKITGDKIAKYTITGDNIENNSINSEKIMGTIPASKLSGVVRPGYDTKVISTAMLQDNSVTTSKLSDDSVTGSKMARGSLHPSMYCRYELKEQDRATLNGYTEFRPIPNADTYYTENREFVIPVYIFPYTSGQSYTFVVNIEFGSNLMKIEVPVSFAEENKAYGSIIIKERMSNTTESELLIYEVDVTCSSGKMGSIETVRRSFCTTSNADIIQSVKFKLECDGEEAEFGIGTGYDVFVPSLNI